MIESIFWYFFHKIKGCLFWFVLKLFVLVVWFNTETESFDVSIEPKLTEDHLKQFDREHILVIFTEFRVVLVCFETVLFVLVVWI